VATQGSSGRLNEARRRWGRSTAIVKVYGWSVSSLGTAFEVVRSHVALARERRCLAGSFEIVSDI
jgi:hypothetical protein